MSRKYKFHNPEGVYFVSFAVQGWVDPRCRAIAPAGARLYLVLLLEQKIK
jgi:hypothetical protein